MKFYAELQQSLQSSSFSYSNTKRYFDSSVDKNSSKQKGSGKLITNTCTNRQTDRQVGNIMPQTAHRMGDTGQKKHNTIPVILTIL